MENYAKEYLEDYTKNYMIIGGVPTSPFGVTLAKRCKWCYNVMNPNSCQSWKDNSEYFNHENKQGVMRKIFCSEDCRQEFRDWEYVNTYRRTLQRNREISKKYWRAKHPIPTRKISGLTRTEYLKIYHVNNKEKRQRQMRERRMKLLNNK